MSQVEQLTDRGEQPDWHGMAPAAVLAAVGSSEAGLDDDEASRRLERYGENVLTRKGGPSAFRILVRQFANVLVCVLMVAAAVSVGVGEYLDAGAIMAIVILNAVFGFLQEYRAEQAVEALRKLASPTAIVLRSGQQRQVEASKVVPGDVLVLETGAKVSADARLLESVNLKADESLLTGESVPVSKRSEALAARLAMADRANMAYMGTNVSYGRGRAVVVNTGMATEMGEIAEQVQAPEVTRTTLEVKIARLAKWLTIGIVALGAVLFVVGVIAQRDPIEMFMMAVSLAVSAIPEGLPAVVTLSLALAVRRMAKRNAIVKRLAASETLGSTTVICSDKTGTMTANEMTVARIYADGRFLEVSGVGYQPEGEIGLDGEAIALADWPVLERLAQVGVLCNDAELARTDEMWDIIGNPTEGALLPLARKIGLDERELREQMPRVHEVPFDSERKRMSTVHPTSDDGLLVAIKGAPEVLLQYCTRVLTNAGVRELEPERVEQTLSAATEMAADALRVLGLAYKLAASDTDLEDAEHIESGLILVGLVGMIDPARPEVRPAIELCQQGGVRVIMLTGDHKITAAAVGRQIGMLEEGDRVVTGEDVARMDEQELAREVERIAVYARLAPPHKVRILRALQARGEVVGMTGDGVNDAPALKRSDIGVGMALKGTDVTREVSDIVLADDNFSTIVAAVEEGRIVYDNIRKFTRFLLSANFDEFITISVAILLGWPLPLLPLQILWINIVTDGLPALALGVGPAEDGVMDRPPRDPRENMLADMLPFLVVAALVAAACALAAFRWELAATGDLVMARTLVLTQVVCFELFLVFNCQSDRASVWEVGFRNRALVGAVLISALMHLCLVYLPFTQGVFKLAPMELADWGRILALSLPALAISPRWLVARGSHHA